MVGKKRQITQLVAEGGLRRGKGRLEREGQPMTQRARRKLSCNWGVECRCKGWSREVEVEGLPKLLARKRPCKEE